MIDLQIVWQTKWDALPLDPTGALYPTNVANFIDDRITGLTVPGITGSVTFTFMKALFAAGITGLAPDPTGAIGPAAFAAAFSSSCSASIILIPSGDSVGASAPPTLFSAPPTSMFSPASVTAGAASLQAALLAAKPAPLPLTSAYPKALYSAFTSLMVMATGLNSIPPPAGPTPLIFTGGVL